MKKIYANLLKRTSLWTNYVDLKTKNFLFTWFSMAGNWYIYLCFRDKFVKISSEGFDKGSLKSIS